jgi:RB1-inducible coiled-coil protein 1
MCDFSVKQLQDVIERSCGIPVEKQVLLVSGGECLDPAARVCSYSAGTDTNPIYLFSKSTIESVTPPSLSIDFGPGIVYFLFVFQRLGQFFVPTSCVCLGIFLALLLFG